ncbi:MAG: SatD family protein [Clostridiales bacterium]|nr:SatD family protein [Clostridiales bacterium]
MYCVILGDMVNSRVMLPQNRDEAGILSRQVFEEINRKYRTYMLSGFELSGGDSFEAVLLAQYKAPEIIQKLIQELYSVSRLRISVGLGELHTFGDGNQRVNTMDGPAFHIAADAMAVLKKKRSSHWLQLAIQTNREAQPLIDATLFLLSAVTVRWTDRQRKAVWGIERLGGDIALLAEEAGVTGNAIRKHLKAANHEAYRRAWRSIEEYLANMDKDVLRYSDKRIGYTIYFNTACRNFDAGNLTLAEENIIYALNSAELEFGNNDSKLAPILNKQGETLLKEQRYEDAVHVLERSLAVQEGLPPGRDAKLQALLLMVEAQYRLGRLSEAERILSTGRSIEMAMKGERAPAHFNWEAMQNKL